MYRATLLLPVLLLLAACATMEGKQKEKILESVLLSYEKSIRWSEFARADELRRLPEGADTPASAGHENIRVTAYREIARKELVDGIAINVRIDYYHIETMSVSSIVDEQVWQYDEAGKTWFISTPLPRFR